MQRVHPSRAFITAGLDETTNKYYAALMVRKPKIEGEPEPENPADQFEPRVRGTQPFDTADAAKMQMAERYQHIAVYNQKEDLTFEFLYPYWSEQREKFAERAAAERAGKMYRRRERHYKGLLGKIDAKQELADLENYLEFLIGQHKLWDAQDESPERAEALEGLDQQIAWSRGRQTFLTNQLAEQETAKQKQSQPLGFKMSCPRKKQRGGKRKARTS